MYTYQKTKRYFAQVADDIKDLAEMEMASLGAEAIKQAYRGLHFQASSAALYRINYCSALINRVLAPIITFSCHSDKYLYNTAVKIKWDDFISSSATFAVFSSVSHSNIKHSRFAALRLKDAIADYFRGISGVRPSVDTRHPDLWVSLHIEQNEATISIDTSGGSLHRRGYRKKSIQAPMSETLAASILKLTEWNEITPLYDPFCGSGTILCEAYLKCTKTPPGYLRDSFGFKKLPDYKEDIWLKIKKESNENIKTLPDGLIAGSDKNNQAIKATYQNLEQIDTANKIKVNREDVFKLKGLEKKVIICNPPYGLRLNADDDLSEFYKNLGDFLKQRCRGSVAFIYFGERKYIKNIGLKSSWKKELSNGGLDGRLVKYDLY